MIKTAEIDEIVIKGVTYVPKGSGYAPARLVNGLKLVILRTKNAGVWIGYLKSKIEQTATLLNARNLWYWSGATTVSQLSEDGVNKPGSCKFPQEVSEVELEGIISTHPVSAKAKQSIDSVPVWKV